MIRWLAPGILNRTVNPYIFTFVNFFTLVYIAAACEDFVKFELYMCCACVRPLKYNDPPPRWHTDANRVTGLTVMWLDNRFSADLGHESVILT
jgi:hypothetical protein